MPDILRVRYLGDAPAVIPLAGREVEPDTVFDLAAKLVDDDEGQDHVVVEVGNPPERRLLQRALFRVETSPKTRAAARKET
jgi:hypothetical protein